MIVKDEENIIARCLDSAYGIADEIIIIDTGSKDRTKEICSKYTDKIFDFEWIDNFAAARNYAFSKASKEYILWMDADDVILEEDRVKFLQFKKELDNTVDSVAMLYNLAINEYGKASLSYRRNRLVKRSRNFTWHGVVHEYLEVNGKVINSEIAITHKKMTPSGDRNLKIYRRKLENGETFTPRDVLYYGNELYEHNFMEEALENYTKFLDMDGWFEDKINVCGKISDYYSNIGNYAEAINYSLQSFKYDVPRAEFCCRMGYNFLQQNDIHQAIFWYKTATELQKPENSMGFLNDACWTWLPHLQLCLCYDKIGNYELAYKHNSIAEKYRPNDDRILYNKEYFINEHKINS